MRLLMLPVLLSALCLLPAGCNRATSPPGEAKAAATTGPELPPEVVSYLATLETVKAASKPVSMEKLFDEAEAAQIALMEVTGDQAVLERYSDSEFAALQEKVHGLELHRGMDIYAQPQPAFFLALARVHGGPADVAFFENYAATWGPDLVPTYLKLRRQPSPCVRFGEGLITPLYQRWSDFAKAFPDAYTKRAAQHLTDLEETLVLGTCACGDLDSVRNEQTLFIKAFPDAPQASAIQERSAELLSNPDRLPVNCF